MGFSLSESSQIALIKAKIKPGCIIHVFCDFIHVPSNKFCIIVHTDYESNFFLLFLVNSNIAPFIQKNPDMARCQIPLYKAEYTFFTKDVSHINCAEPFDDLDVDYAIHHLISTPDDYKGMLQDKEIFEIIQRVNSSKTISNYEKGLIINSLGN